MIRGAANIQLSKRSKDLQMKGNVTNNFEQQAIRAGQIHLNAKIDSLTGLLADFKAEKYTEMYQVEGHINNQLDLLNKLKGENDE